MSESILNQTKSNFTCTGTVYEKALTKTDITIDAGPKDEKKKVDTELISGPVSVRIPGGIVNFYLYVTKIGYNGKDSFQWAMAEAALTGWSPEINGDGEKPTKVMISGELNPRDYVDDKTGNLRYDIGLRIGTANTRVSEDAPEGLTIKLDAFVQSMKKEVKNDEETGRLIINLLGANYSGRCYPIECVVDEEGVDTVENGEDDFEAFEVGQTRTNIELDYRIVSEAPPVDTSKKRMIGKGSGVEVHSRTKTSVELVLYAADCSPIEEPEETEDENGNPIEDKSGYINPATMKKALKVRAAYLEELQANPPEKKGKTESFEDKKKKAAGKSKTVGKGANKPPFDMGDDDDGDPDF